MLILLLIISLAPIIILSYFEIRTMKETVTENFINSTEREIVQVDNQIEMYFDTIKSDVRMLASNNQIRENYNQITSYVKQTNEELLKPTPLENSSAEAKVYRELFNYVDSLSRTNSTYAYLATDSGGYVQCPTTKIEKNYDPRQKPFYKLAMKNQGEVVITAPYDSIRGIGGHHTTISIAKTVKNKAGNVIGVLGIDVNIEVLTNLMQNVSAKTVGKVILTTEQGTILGHPRYPNKYAFQGIEKLGIEKLNNLSEIKRKSFTDKVNDVNYLMQVNTAPKTGWKFISLIPKEKIQEELIPIYKRIAVVSLLFIIIVIITAVIFANRFSQPLIAAADFAQKIAKGDLNADKLEVEGDDEIAILSSRLNNMQDDLKQIIANVFELIEDLSSYSREISQVNQKLNQTFEFIQSVEEGNQETASAIDEVALSIEQISKGTEELSIKAEKISDLGEETFAIVKETDDKIHAGTTLVDQAVEIMEELGESVAKVDTISEDMMKLADEINLLSLDGAVEAANSDSNTNFGHVADDIRELSDESRELAEEVQRIVDEIKSVTAKATKIMIPKKNNEANIADTFREIQTSADNLLAKMKQVIEATEDQVASTEEISASIEEISASSEEVSSQAEEMYENTQELESVMSQVAESNEELKQGFKQQAQASKQKLEEINIEI